MITQTSKVKEFFSGAVDKATDWKNLAFAAAAIVPIAAFANGNEPRSDANNSGLSGNESSITGVTKSPRVDPITLGLNIVKFAKKFNYQQNYNFTDLQTAPKYMYFCYPTDGQSQRIFDTQWTIKGTKLNPTVVNETPGWKFARVDVSEVAGNDRSLSVQMSVKGAYFDSRIGKAGESQPQYSPEYMPRVLTEEEYQWITNKNPLVAKLKNPGFRDYLETNKLLEHDADVVSAASRVYGFMKKTYAYDQSGGFLDRVLTTNKVNCNGSNQFVSSAFEEKGFIAIEENVIVMGTGDIHMHSQVGLPNTNRLLTTDGVLFDNDIKNPEGYFKDSMGPTLVFQRGLEFRWKDPETNAKFNVLNHGGMVYLFDKDGNRIGVSGGVKGSFEIEDVKPLDSKTQNQETDASQESQKIQMPVQASSAYTGLGWAGFQLPNLNVVLKAKD